MATKRNWVVVDTRQTCGNSVFFWASGRCGYTLDIRMAELFTKEEALHRQNSRESDKAFPLADLLKLVQHHVDCQDLYGEDKKRQSSHVFSHLED